MFGDRANDRDLVASQESAWQLLEEIVATLAGYEGMDNLRRQLKPTPLDTYRRICFGRTFLVLVRTCINTCYIRDHNLLTWMESRSIWALAPIDGLASCGSSRSSMSTDLASNLPTDHGWVTGIILPSGMLHRMIAILSAEHLNFACSNGLHLLGSLY